MIDLPMTIPAHFKRTFRFIDGMGAIHPLPSMSTINGITVETYSFTNGATLIVRFVGKGQIEFDVPGYGITGDGVSFSGDVATITLVRKP